MALPVDRRDWLRANGFTVGARGRFSSPMWDAMDKAERNGVAFIDKKAPTFIGKGTHTDENGVTTVTTVEVNPFAHHRASIRTQDRYTFSGNGERLSVSVRDVCCNPDCMLSFGWCYCDVPTFRNWRTGTLLTMED